VYIDWTGVGGMNERDSNRELEKFRTSRNEELYRASVEDVFERE
jgi:hypothetical protein